MKTKTTKTKKAKSVKTTRRTCLGTCSTEKWLKSTRTRPKTVMLTLQRTTTGYTVQDAIILNRVNQHGVLPINADVRAISNDIMAKGISI